MRMETIILGALRRLEAARDRGGELASPGAGTMELMQAGAPWQGETRAEQVEQVIAILGDIAERSRKLVEDFIARQADLDPAAAVTSGVNGKQLLGGSFVELLTRLMSNPQELVQAQFQLWQNYVRLWHTTTQRMLGAEVEPVIVPDHGDRRFKDAAWN